MRRVTLLPLVLALILAACGTDEGDASPSEEPIGTPMASMDATESMGDGDEAGLTLDDVMNEPELYLDGNVSISADIASAIESANAWILEAGDEAVLLIGPRDNDGEFSEGDAVVINGMFMEFNPAEIGELEGVVDEAAIVNAFEGEYVIVADTLQSVDS